VGVELGAVGEGAKRLAYTVAVELERRWDAARLSRRAGGVPENFRIVSYLGHGSADRAVLRGRVLDNPEPDAAVDGEGTWAAVRRTMARFLTDELPGVPLRVRLGSVEAVTSSDQEGYFEVLLEAEDASFGGPWAIGQVELAAPYRGITDPRCASVRVRVPEAGAAFGVISDIDDTILLTGAQRAAAMVRQTLTGSALTRVAFIGAPELYRALAAGPTGGGNPVFYVSSSPWNLHGFLTDFLRHRDFPLGPLLLRDLLGSGTRRSHASHKHARIVEVLDLHPDLRFVLIGDSGQHDPQIYADIVRGNPGRVLAVYIREVRLDPGDRRVEAVTDAWDEDVPFVLAADSAALARHAAGLGLIPVADAHLVERATAPR
jgi:phosphatidate phosphatase APP1